MRAVSDQRTIMPLRQYIDIPGSDGKFTLMPGYIDEPRSFGFKVVAKYPRAPDSPYGSHVGAVMVFDADEGIPVAMVDGAELTAIRTSAASALATRELARQDATVLAILGTGAQAEHHIHAIRAVRAITHVRIWGRHRERAQALVQRMQLPDNIQTHVADDAANAVLGADIVCTTTAAKTPLLSAASLAEGCHVNLVGAAIIEAAEVDVDVVAKSRFFVDYRPSAMAQAGELAAAIEQGVIDASHIAGEIGEVLSGRIDARQHDEQLTVYKSLGVAAQDLAAAMAACANAQQHDLGVNVDWH